MFVMKQKIFNQLTSNRLKLNYKNACIPNFMKFHEHWKRRRNEH